MIAAGQLQRADVLVRDGRIAAVEAALEPHNGCQVLDAAGCVVGPGLVDLHSHLRQPGTEEAETIETGARAAALGGYTAVVAMPNTDPPVDCAAVVRDVLALAEGAACHVAVAGTITIGREGQLLSPMAEMADLGVRIFTDDGRGVQDGGLMRRAMEYAGALGVTLAQHCEDEALARGGHMHEGAWSSRLGVPGQPSIAEEAMVARDLALAALTGTRLHLLHLSTAGSVDLVRRAKSLGTRVTAEVAPHHLFFTDAAVAGYDPVFKVNPPLRAQADVDALRAALHEGVFDAVATDHAPHPPELKDEPFDKAPPGMLGLETAIAAVHTVLTQDGRTGSVLPALFDLFSVAPAAIAGLAGPGGQGGAVEVGGVANLCVFDPAARWCVDAGQLASRSRNSPFHGRELIGRARHTVLRGEPVVVDGSSQR